MSNYKTARIEDIGEITDGRLPWRPVRFAFGIQSFGINAFTAREAGERMINEHDEAGSDDSEEELYLVQAGRARFELDGEAVDAPAGTFVFVPGPVTRTAFAEEPGTTIVAVGGSPGKAYEDRGWDLWGPLSRLYDAGDYAAVADRGRDLVARHPEYPMFAYNVACCEALDGRTTDAMEHLRIAVEASEQLRTLAGEDSDLDSLRGEPGFSELLKA